MCLNCKEYADSILFIKEDMQQMPWALTRDDHIVYKT